LSATVPDYIYGWCLCTTFWLYWKELLYLSQSLFYFNIQLNRFHIISSLCWCCILTNYAFAVSHFKIMWDWWWEIYSWMIMFSQWCYKWYRCELFVASILSSCWWRHNCMHICLKGQIFFSFLTQKSCLYVVLIYHIPELLCVNNKFKVFLTMYILYAVATQNFYAQFSLLQCITVYIIMSRIDGYTSGLVSSEQLSKQLLPWSCIRSARQWFIGYW